MAPPSARTVVVHKGPSRLQRRSPCYPQTGASHDTSRYLSPPPDLLQSRLEAVDRDVARGKFALYGRQYAHVDHVSGTEEVTSIVLQSTMLLQEDGLLATRLDDVSYLLDGLQTSMKTPRGRLAQARNVLELTKLLQDPRVLQAIELSSQRRRTQDRTKQLLTQEQDGLQEEPLRVALAVLTYFLSKGSDTQDFIDDKVLDAIVCALKREVVLECRDGEEKELQILRPAQEPGLILKKTCLKRKQTSKPRATLEGPLMDDEKGRNCVADETIWKLLNELLHGHEELLIEGELKVSTADTLCAALVNLLRVDETDAASGDAVNESFKLIQARKRQLVRNGGVDVLVYGLANRLRVLERLLSSSVAQSFSGQFTHSLYRVSMVLCVFEQVTTLMEVDVQQFIAQRRTLFMLLLKLIRLLSELSWSEARRWELEATRMSLAVEVLLSALRVLINLTHHNAEAAENVHSLGGMQLLANSFCQLWSLVHHSQLQNKWEYDAYLLLLSVMVNSIEFSAKNHAALSNASLCLSVENGLKEVKISACELFTQFFLAKVESYVNLINLTENGGAISITEESDHSNPEDVILGGCASLLLGYLMKNSSINSAAILKLLPDDSPRLLLRALGVFVAFHSQMGALTPEVANSVLLIETVLKSSEQFDGKSAETDIEEVSMVSIEDPDVTRSNEVSPSPLRARQLRNVCSNIDDSDEDDSPYSKGRKLDGSSKNEASFQSPDSQTIGMRTPTRIRSRSPGKSRQRAKSPLKTPPRSRVKSPLRDDKLSVTAVLPDGSLASPVVARLLKRTRELVEEFDAEFVRQSRCSPEKRSGGTREDTVDKDSASSPCMVLSMDVTCRDNGSEGLDLSQDTGKEKHSIEDCKMVYTDDYAGLSSKRRVKPLRNPDLSSESITTYHDTSFGFSTLATPPSTPLRKKSKILLQTPTRKGCSPGLYRQSPSLNLTPTKTPPSTSLRFNKSTELQRISSKNAQPSMDQSLNSHRRKMKGSCVPSAPATESSVFDFTD